MGTQYHTTNFCNPESVQEKNICQRWMVSQRANNTEISHFCSRHNKLLTASAGAGDMRRHNMHETSLESPGCAVKSGQRHV